MIPAAYIKGTDEKLKFLIKYNSGNRNNAFHISSYVAITALKLFFCCFNVICIMNFLKWDKIKNVTVFRIIILYTELILAFIINLVSILIEGPLLFRIDLLLFNQIVFFPFLLSYRYPDILNNFSIEISRVKYKQSQAKGKIIDPIILRLNELLK